MKTSNQLMLFGLIGFIISIPLVNHPDIISKESLGMLFLFLGIGLTSSGFTVKIMKMEDVENKNI